ncbi:MAG: glycosyltransferase family 4 protein [Alphaproteobacteria bacterium]|nr:glycosyltransferase family 4 protein [Alphaproteobacteria bacterium]
MRIAFHAPMKPPDHPVPSGDRRVGRLLWQALERAGHQVAYGSEMRIYDGEGEDWHQRMIEDAAAQETRTLLAAYRRHPEGVPQLWFTYHNYYKAPDLIGPAIARALHIPYFLAESSHAPKRAGGPWARWHGKAAEATLAADRLICFTRLDRTMLARLAGEEKLADLPAFIDAAPFLAARRESSRRALAARHGIDAGPVWLLSVAMMRSRDKLDSYRRLAAALALLAEASPDWRLLVAGDGPARKEVEEAFRPFGARIAFLGAQEEAALPALYAAADLYVWPAVNEAFGMAFLEAQAGGLPVIAGRVRGVPDVVREGETALLVGETPEAFAAALSPLLGDAPRRRRMGEAARHFIAAERDLPAAARRLGELIAPYERP